MTNNIKSQPGKTSFRICHCKKTAQFDKVKYAEKSGRGGEKMDKKTKRSTFISVQDPRVYKQ